MTFYISLVFLKLIFPVDFQILKHLQFQIFDHEGLNSSNFIVLSILLLHQFFGVSSPPRAEPLEKMAAPREIGQGLVGVGFLSPLHIPSNFVKSYSQKFFIWQNRNLSMIILYFHIFSLDQFIVFFFQFSISIVLGQSIASLFLLLVLSIFLD